MQSLVCVNDNNLPISLTLTVKMEMWINHKEILELVVNLKHKWLRNVLFLFLLETEQSNYTLFRIAFRSS
jgi:hypothetical protein